MTRVTAQQYALSIGWHPVTARKAFWAWADGEPMLCDACGNWQSVPGGIVAVPELSSSDQDFDVKGYDPNWDTYQIVCIAGCGAVHPTKRSRTPMWLCPECSPVKKEEGEAEGEGD